MSGAERGPGTGGCSSPARPSRRVAPTCRPSSCSPTRWARASAGPAFRYACAAAERSLELGAESAALLETERSLELWSPDEGAEVRARSSCSTGGCCTGSLTTTPVPQRPSRRPPAASMSWATSSERRARQERWQRPRWWSGDREALEEVRAAAHDLPRGGHRSSPRLEALNALARPLMLSGLAREASRIAEEGLALVPPRAPRRARLQRVNLLTTLGTCRFILADFAAGEEILATSALTALDLRDPVSACRAYHNVAFGSTTSRGWPRTPRPASPSPATPSCARMSARSSSPWPRARPERGDFARAGALCDEAEAVTGPGPGWPTSVSTSACRAPPSRSPAGDADDARAQLSAVLERLRTAHELGEWAAFAASRWRCSPRGRRPRPATRSRPRSSAPIPGSYARILALPIAVEVAAAEGSSPEARRLAGELARIAPDHPRTTFSAASRTRRAKRRAPPPRSSRRRAREEAGRRVEAARWRLAGASALSGADDAGATELATRALAANRDMGVDGWSRRAEQALRRLGVRVPSRLSGAGLAASRRARSRCAAWSPTACRIRAIAERLFISQKTAGRHVSNLFAKLGVHSRGPGRAGRLERGLLGDDDPGQKMGRSPDGGPPA